MGLLAPRGGHRIWAPVLAAAFVVSLIGASASGCGTDGGSSTGERPDGAEAIQAGAESHPVSTNETGRQTLARARKYIADRPALKALLDEGVRICSADELLVLAKRFGSPADPLALGTAYSQRFEGTERIQAAALGCYLGAQVRLEHDQGRGENE